MIISEKKKNMNNGQWIGEKKDLLVMETYFVNNFEKF